MSNNIEICLKRTHCVPIYVVNVGTVNWFLFSFHIQSYLHSVNNLRQHPVLPVWTKATLHVTGGEFLEVPGGKNARDPCFDEDGSIRD